MTVHLKGYRFLTHLGLSLAQLSLLVVGITGMPSVILAQADSSESVQPASLTRPVLKEGSQGAEVSELQATLKLLGYYTGSVDGVYSESTAEAVSQFQEAAGLPVTGITDQNTWDRLLPPDETSSAKTDSKTACVCPEPTSSNSQSSSPRTVSLPILRLGMRGNAVIGLQERLRSKGFLQGEADGIFGPKTQAAVKAVQEESQLKPDGVVGLETWIAILR